MLFGSTSPPVVRVIFVSIREEDNRVPLLFAFDAGRPAPPPLLMLGGVTIALLLLGRLLGRDTEVETTAREDGGADSLVHSPQFLITRETVSLMRTQWKRSAIEAVVLFIPA